VSGLRVGVDDLEDAMRRRHPVTAIIERKTQAIDETGKTYGQLAGIERMPGRAMPTWRWQCSCGRVIIRLSQTVHQDANDKRRAAPVACPDCVKAFRASQPRKPVVRVEKPTPEPTQRVTQKICKRCYGLSHARPLAGLCKCGLGREVA
jgi:hypothetical protein